MTMINKYCNRSHISEAKFRQKVRLFVQDLAASKMADVSSISQVSINKLLLKIRCRLAHLCEQPSPFCGEIEVDESDFGARRIRGKRGRGTSGKTIVFKESEFRFNHRHQDLYAILLQEFKKSPL